MRYPKTEILTLVKRYGLNPKIYVILRAKLNGDIAKVKGYFNDITDFYSFYYYTVRPKYVIVSKNYLILGKDAEKSDNAIILGINDNGKIFVNWLSLSSVVYWINDKIERGEKGIEYKRINNDIEVYKVMDRVIYFILGYEKELSNEKVLDEKTTYRVQGDLTMYYIPYQNFIDEVYTRIEDQVRNFLEITILRRIQRTLEQKGIMAILSRDLNSRLSVIIQGVSRKWSDREKYKIIKAIAELIKNELYLDDIIPIRYIKEKEYYPWSYHEYPTDIFVKFYDCEKEVITKERKPAIMVDVTIGQGTWGFPYLPVVIMVTIESTVVRAWSYRIMKECKQQIDDLVSLQRVHRGKHTIEYYGYPREFTIIYSPRFIEKSIEDNNVMFSIRINAIYTTKPTIRIIHPEHGEIKLKMRHKKCRVTFGSTNTLEENDDVIIARRNSYILKEWARQ